jgi:hypothetical protein
MNPTVFNGHYIVDRTKMNFDRDVEIHFCRMGETSFPNHLLGSKFVKFKSKNSYKVFCNFTEPKVSPNIDSEEFVIQNANLFDLILTTREQTLKTVPHATKFLYGTTWLYREIDHLDAIGFYHPSLDVLHENKTDTVSFLMTSHKGQSGYSLRHEIWNSRDKFDVNRLFYSSTRHRIEGEPLLPNDDKKELFSSKYSIIIENCQEKDYFTEKIIDCLLTKTVPIYCGCPNISDYFDMNGILVFDSLESLHNKVSDIKDGFYEKNIKAINKNFEIAKEFARPVHERLEEVIKEKIA